MTDHDPQIDQEQDGRDPLAPFDAAAGESQAEPGIEDAAPPPRFCRHCGRPWEPEWSECAACAASARTDGDAGYPDRKIGHPVRAALTLYFLILATTLLTALAIAAGEGGEITGLFVDSVVFSLLVLIWCVFDRRAVWPGLRAGAAPLWYLGAVVFAVITFLVASAAVDGLVRLLPIDEILLAGPILDAGHGWGVVILVVCVQPAIIEELAFRGVILSGLSKLMHTREAVVVSAMMFSIIHLSIISFPHLLLIGLVLGYLRVRTGSLYPCILMHFAHNFLTILSEGRA